MNTARAILLLSVVLVLAALAPNAAPAQVTVAGGNQLLSITTGFAGGEPVAVTNSNSSLRYKAESVITKITVSTSCPGQRFTLKVLAVNPKRGVPAPQVTLVDGMPAADFVTGIPANAPGNITCTLSYTASATFAQGNSTELGNDVHTVTYTILAQ